METSYEKNPRKLLGCLMALAMVFSTSSTLAEDLTIVVGGGSFDSEITWDITDASGASLVAGPLTAGTYNFTIASGCYDFQMCDSWGDGWNECHTSLQINFRICICDRIFSCWFLWDGCSMLAKCTCVYGQ